MLADKALREMKGGKKRIALIKLSILSQKSLITYLIRSEDHDSTSVIQMLLPEKAKSEISNPKSAI